MKNHKYLADYHMHSYFSNDTKCPAEDMVRKAISLGFDEIALTDHVDYGVKSIENCNYEKYFTELEMLKKKYENKIKVKIGIEFGIQEHTINKYQEDFEKYPFDFILLSNHQINDQEFWNYKYQEGKTQEEFQRGYYKAILNVIKRYKNYSVLAHLDVIRRYDKYGDFPNEIVLECIEPILEQVIADGKGIEINTSSFRYGLPELMPSRMILKKYYELGGKIITIGSDAHSTEYIGSHFDTVKRELRKIGFTHFCTFNKMIPMFHEL